MVTELYLIRHGMTEWNELGKYQGHHDLPLSAPGIRQARKIAGRLQGLNIAAVYSSDLLRAVQTAAPIAETRGLPVIPLKELREVDVGLWEGKSLDEVKQRHSKLYEEWLLDTVNNPIPGGESYAQLRDRVIPKVMELVKVHKGASLCIVSHSGPLKSILCHVLGTGPEGRRRFDLINASISLVSYSDNREGRVRFLNDTCHLLT